MNYAQSEGFLEDIKVVVPVQQFVAGFDAERRDQAVDGFAYRVAFPSQHLITSGSGCGQLNAARTEYVES